MKCFLFSLCFGITSLLTAQTAPLDCENLDRILVQKGETPADRPWAESARRLAKRSAAGKSLSGWIHRCQPELVRSLHTDGQGPWLSAWGRSVNYDEHGKDIIVLPPLLEALAQEMPEPPTVGGIQTSGGWSVGHAGITHTYGYLFSLLQTPFGYKRARWVSPELEQGFGLPQGTLGPKPSEGTFLVNVTDFFAQIAFSGQTASPYLLDRFRSPASALTKFRFSDLKGYRLVESTQVRAADGTVRSVDLITDLVQFSQTPVVGKDRYLLVYSIRDPNEGGVKLITGFPVTTDFVDELRNPKTLGDGQKIVTRYNGYIAGLTENGGLGTRRLIPR